MTITGKTQQAYQLMHDGILALSRAEQQGIRVDMEYLENKEKHLSRKIERLEKKIYQTKFYRHWQHSLKVYPNIYSNQQLAAYLYNIKNLKPTKSTDSGQGATDEEALLALGIPEIEDLIQCRKLKKIKDTYLKGFMREQVNGVIHPFYNLHLVKTFRSSSDRPNFQNIPKRDKESMEATRKALYPRKGHLLLEVDYGSLEVRIAACYHKDSTMLKYINDPTTDMHADMTAQLFKIPNFDRDIPEYDLLRSATKNSFVFPQFYGDYYANCADNLAQWAKLPHRRWKESDGVPVPGGNIGGHLIKQGLPSFDKFVEHVKEIEQDFWENRFGEYADWKERWWSAYQKNGYITTLTNFTCSGNMSKNDCINYPVQGSAFHCLLWSFIQLDKIIRFEKWDTRLIGQIHDAIILDVHPDELDMVIKRVRKVTCHDLPNEWKWINVPLEVDFEICPVDGSWAEKKKMKE